MQPSSNFAELFSDETRVKVKRVSRIFEALIFTAVLFASGLFTGYWVANQQCLTQDVVQERTHQQEIERLNSTYREALNYLTGRVTQAATDSSNAASVAEGAAQTANQVAKRIDKTAAKVGSVPEPTRDQVNRAVQRANSAIGERQ